MVSVMVCLGHTSADVDASDSTPATVRKKPGQERKARKTSTLVKKTILQPSGRSSRIENSSARLLVSQGEPAGTTAAEKTRNATHTHAEMIPPMDASEPLSTAPPPPPPASTDVLASVLKDSSSTSAAVSPSTPSSSLAAAFAVPDFPPLSNPEQTLQPGHTRTLTGQPGTEAVLEGPASTLLLPVPDGLDTFPAVAANLPQTVTPGSEGTTNRQPAPSCSSPHRPASPASTCSRVPVAADSQSASTSVGLPTPHSSPALASSAPPSCAAAVGEARDHPPQQGLGKPGADPSVLSLKIIIRDDKDEDSCSDPALSQAVSSISGDKIPTIYLSSPAKAPGGAGTPRISSDEVAQAVSGLQHSEGQASPLSSRAGTLLASPLAGPPALQQNYIIQLPLEGAAPAVQGPPASYFLVTEPPNTEAQPRQVLLSGLSKGPLPFSQYGGPAQASSASYPTGKKHPAGVGVHVNVEMFKASRNPSSGNESLYLLFHSILSWVNSFNLS